MAAYFARRLVGGVVTLFFVGLVIYSLAVMSFQAGLLQLRRIPDACSECKLGSAETHQEIARQLEHMWKLDKPWLLNFAAWLFTPSEIKDISFYWHDGGYDRLIVSRGLEVQLGNLHLIGSGILTGDFGYSVNIEPGKSVLDVFGPGLGVLMLLLPLTLFASMALVFIQRWRRPVKGGSLSIPQQHELVTEYKQRINFSGSL